MQEDLSVITGDYRIWPFNRGDTDNRIIAAILCLLPAGRMSTVLMTVPLNLHPSSR